METILRYKKEWGFHTEAEFMNVISLRFLNIILRVLRLEVSVHTMFTLQPSFEPILPKGGRGVVEVTVNSNEENSDNFCNFCPNYVQEFGLCSCSTAWALQSPYF